ncbi:hypothetical protein H261_10364 [Paramagnetospirillum caucaseum]|uniref:EAL domain-containing protein n=1 Tax=Paramagnetospirillum caucaseum TaxID=1244869 RepID=M3ABB7_9PROT|nr:hypothetical protein [Paramagnetospirillum caucaseum]EME70078.1 hypothetical protein H261_10364 [Paramagnetospirillum caucaseum]
MTEHFTDREAFETIVRAMLERGGQGSFGRIHLVSVLPDAEGASLGATLPKALSIAEHIIQRRLSPEDACVPLEQGKYMLVFPGLSDTEGMIKATAISREIKERLFGQSAGHIHVSVQVLPLERLKHRPAAAALPAMDSVLETHERHTAVNLQVVFQPVWDVTRQAVIGNRAMTRRHFQGHELLDDAVQLAGEQDPLARERNAHLLRAVAASPGNHGLVIMPQALNDHTMTNCREITTGIHHLMTFCPDGLMVELTGAVNSASRGRLRDVIHAIMAGGASVGVRIFPEPEMAKFLKDCGVSHLCFNEAQAKQAAFTHSALYALLAVVAHEVRGAGLGLALWNTSSGQDIKRAVSLGFSLFSGASFGASRPGMVQPAGWPVDKVFL